ncbi:hypothetical protein [Oryzomonas rubra]|nr:hypothetical protein [Oryzomonas rubra]
MNLLKQVVENPLRGRSAASQFVQEPNVPIGTQRPGHDDFQQPAKF